MKARLGYTYYIPPDYHQSVITTVSTKQKERSQKPTPPKFRIKIKRKTKAIKD